MLITACAWPINGRAETEWTPVTTSPKITQDQKRYGAYFNWDAVTQMQSVKPNLIWEQLSSEQSNTAPEDLGWIEPSAPDGVVGNAQKNSSETANTEQTDGLRWPNGQLMSEEDQQFFRTAYSRGSMIQIGDTVYPNIGYNALQRKPGSFVNFQIAAIDDSWQAAPSPCKDNDFLDVCSDGLMQNWLGLWASDQFSLDLQWTIHSLSGEGAPFSFSTGDIQFGAEDTGTKFGEGQSLGFKLSKNFGRTFGVSFGADRLIHLDKTTDLPRNLHITGTKIFRLNDSLEPPIINISLGVMSDVYNPDTNLGTMRYPKWMRGGIYPSIFSATFDNYLEEGYTENTAGVSSAFVCAEQSIYQFKPLSSAKKDCIKDVFIGPIASIGFAPWPWIGAYAMYNSDINIGVSLKPLKNIHWQFGFELVAPIKGINRGTDRHIDFIICTDDNHSFGKCRTRLGFFTDLSF